MCQASPWRDYTIFVADLDDYSNVYVVKENEPTDALYPIEKLTKHGTTCEVKLFHFNQKLYCAIVDVNNADRYSEQLPYLVESILLNKLFQRHNVLLQMA